MKNNIDFDDCIKSQQLRILKIHMDKLMPETEKINRIAECRKQIKFIEKSKVDIAMRELRRTKQNKYLKTGGGYETLMASLFLLFTLLFSCKSDAQAYIEGGVNSLGMSFDAGAKLNSFDFGAGIDFSEFSKSTIPAIFHGNIGYDINVNDFIITPIVGISRVKVTETSKDGSPEMNYTKPYLSLKLGKDIECGYNKERLCRPYVFATYSYKFYAGIGLRIYFK